MEIPRCTAIGFLENLRNSTFNEIHQINEEEIEEKLSKNKPIPKPLPSANRGEFLKEAKITVPDEER